MNDRRNFGFARRPVAVAAFACVVSFVALAALAPDGLDGGDPAVYQQQIERGEFAQRSVHIGYYLVVAVLTGFSSDLSDRVFNWTSAAFAAGVIGLLVLATLRLATLPRTALSRTALSRTALSRTALSRHAVPAGLATAAVLLGSWTFVRQAVYAEVYVAQAFFLVLALFLWWRESGEHDTRRGVPFVGAALGVAGLVTPSSALAVLAFPALRLRPRRLALLATTAAATVALALAFVWRDFFFGDRGLLKAAGSRLDLQTAVLKEGFEVVFGAFALLPFLLAGVAALLLERRRRRWVVVLGAMWLPTFLLGERFRDVPVQLPVWVLLAPVTVLGLGALAARLEADAAGPGTMPRRLVLLVAVAAVAVVPPLLVPWAAGEVQSFARLPTMLPWLCVGLVLAGGALAAALVGARPRHAAYAVASAALAANLVFVGALVAERNGRVEGYKAAVHEIDRRSSPGWLAIGGWSRGILLEHYLWGEAYTGRWINSAWLDGGWSDAERDAAWRQLEEALLDGREIWLLGDDAELRRVLADHRYAVSEELVDLSPDLYRARFAPGEVGDVDHVGNVEGMSPATGSSAPESPAAGADDTEGEHEDEHEEDES